jgi:tetratricopeptide (TPR) repeat protein
VAKRTAAPPQPRTKNDELFNESFKQGTELLHGGRAAESVPFLKEALRIKPDNADAAINLGGAYILTKRFREAVDILEPVSQKRPNHAQIWINLGAAYLGNPVLARQEEQESAIAAFERALAIEPTAPSVAYNIGLVYRDMGKTDQALDWFHKALQHNPADKDARSQLRKLEKKEKAEE